ncbi:MAG: DotU family type IV/VI secretion system protein [Myxococcales bacterium]|nr:DotU family type IV/VI secretion system protein [Myxococcales bacterium]
MQQAELQVVRRWRESRRAGRSVKPPDEERQKGRPAAEGCAGQWIDPLVFAAMRLQRDGDRKGRPGGEVDEELFGRLQDLREGLSRVQGIAGEDLRDVTYALVGFVDERLTRAQDPLGTYWREAFWERRLFKSADAGVQFFALLEKHLATRNLPVLEVYYRCLMLGFAGQYRGGGEHELDAITRRLTEVLDAELGLAQAVLSPHAKPPREPEFSRSRHTWLSALVLGFAGLAVSSYAASCASLRANADDLVLCAPIGRGDSGLCRSEWQVDR